LGIFFWFLKHTLEGGLEYTAFKKTTMKEEK